MGNDQAGKKGVHIDELSGSKDVGKINEAIVIAGADLSRPAQARPAQHRQHSDRNIGTEADYLKRAPEDLREQFHLPKNAPSGEVFHKMADAGFETFKHASKEWQDETLAALNLQGSQWTRENVFNAMIAKERRELGLPNASYEQLEIARHKANYKLLKSRKVPVDVD